MYFDDGSIKLFGAKEIVTKGIFQVLQDINKFKDTCAVLNGTLAWCLEGTYDKIQCLDIEPFEVYENCQEVEEVKELFSV